MLSQLHWVCQGKDGTFKKVYFGKDNGQNEMEYKKIKYWIICGPNKMEILKHMSLTTTTDEMRT